MLNSRAVRLGLLAIFVALVVGGVLVFRAIDTGSSASAAPGAQDQNQSQDQQTPWLGVYFVWAANGVTIAWVIADSPADTAGLQRGDVIKSVDGTTIDTPADFRDAIQAKAVGDTVTLSIDRDGQTQDVTATLETRPEPLSPAIPLLPELEGIAADELFSHVQGGQFNFTDEQGNPFTVTIDVGTVANVDTGAKSLTVNLNAGGSKTYTVDDTDLGTKLSSLSEGDRVAVVSVGDDVRAVLPGVGALLPGLGRGHGFGPGRMGPFGGFDGFGLGPMEKFREWGHGFGGTMMPGEEESPQTAPTPGSSTGL
jgi:membrane-associated protease RseP (regulator of RpoE activity)